MDKDKIDKYGTEKYKHLATFRKSYQYHNIVN